MEDLTFPPLAGLFLTHFDDIKGQTVIFWKGADLPQGQIEHTSLPSGLHLLQQDFITFTHPTSSSSGSSDGRRDQGNDTEDGDGIHELEERLPACAVFRSKIVTGGRGRWMGSLGVVLPAKQPNSALYTLRRPLEKLFDRLQALPDFHQFKPGGAGSRAPGTGMDSTSGTGVTNPQPFEQASKVLEDVWEINRTQAVQSSSSSDRHGGGGFGIGLGLGVLRTHPISYMPALLAILGPSIVGVYKACLSGKRILLYAPPPFLPLSALGWCTWAIGRPPSNVGSPGSKWMGNVGLVDLNYLKDLNGGWVATTSDAIYRSQTKLYDLFIDLSSCDLSQLIESDRNHSGIGEEQENEDDEALGLPPSYNPIITSTMASTSTSTSTPSVSMTTTKFNYAFADLTFYKSLLILSKSHTDNLQSETDTEPKSGKTIKQISQNPNGQWWLIALSLVENVWKVCVGVCGYALGRGIALPEDDHAGDHRGEEAPLLFDENEEEQNADTEGNIDSEEELKRARLLISQFLHNSYHLYLKLEAVLAERQGFRATGGETEEIGGPRLSSKELGKLCGWGRTRDEERFWSDLYSTWGL